MPQTRTALGGEIASRLAYTQKSEAEPSRATIYIKRIFELRMSDLFAAGFDPNGLGANPSEPAILGQVEASTARW
jgi:hypothetical protein